MKTSNTIRSAFSILVMAALLGHGSSARADGKTYAGAMCVGDTFGRYVGLSTTTGSLTVDVETSLYCPLVGDSELAASKGLNPVRVYLFESTVTPTPPGEQANTSCTIARFGALHGVPYDSQSGTASAGQYTMPLSLTTANGPQWARYSLYCRLTRGSTLYQYDADEIE
jgi:hypothetical protein